MLRKIQKNQFEGMLNYNKTRWNKTWKQRSLQCSLIHDLTFFRKYSYSELSDPSYFFAFPWLFADESARPDGFVN